MYIKPLILSLSLFSFPNFLAAQDITCQSRELSHGMRNIEKYFRSAELELFTLQMMLREWNRNRHIQPDGRWGPETFNAVCGALTTLTAIGNTPISTQGDVQQFARWVVAATRAEMNPGAFEYPD